MEMKIHFLDHSYLANALPSLLLDSIVSKASFGVRKIFYNRDWLGVIVTAVVVHSLSADSPVRKTVRLTIAALLKNRQDSSSH